jgi:hypothetical protein
MKNIKISGSPAILSIFLTVALTYLVYHISCGEENRVLLAMGTFVSVLSTLAFSMSVKFENKRIGMNIKLCSILVFAVMYIANLFFALIGVGVPIYVISQSVLLVAYFFVVWKLFKTNA